MWESFIQKRPLHNTSANSHRYVCVQTAYYCQNVFKICDLESNSVSSLNRNTNVLHKTTMSRPPRDLCLVVSCILHIISVIIIILDEKPFKCTWEDCDRSFKRRESLTDHIKRHKNLPIKVQYDVLHYLDHPSNFDLSCVNELLG